MSLRSAVRERKGRDLKSYDNDNSIIVPASSDEYVINISMTLIPKCIVIRLATLWFAYDFLPYKKTPTNPPIITKTSPNKNPQKQHSYRTSFFLGRKGKLRAEPRPPNLGKFRSGKEPEWHRTITSYWNIVSWPLNRVEIKTTNYLYYLYRVQFGQP